MIRRDDIIEAAADKAKLAARQGAVAFGDAVDRVTPLLGSAAKRVAPVANEAWATARQAKRAAAGIAADTIERIEPTVNSVFSRVAPAVDRAQRTVQDDLFPKMLQILHQAAATPAGRDAREILARLDDQANASIAALNTELAVSRKSSKGKTFATVVLVGAAVGALAIAIRTFLGSREDWAAYEPDEPYVYPDDDYEIDEVLVDTDVTTPEESGTAEAEATADEALAAETAETPAQPAEAPADGSAPYGEGSYSGDNPPEGFTIKGNERSMKYHVPEASGYARTAADVWFSSEEAAQRAGFARSQR